MKELVATVNRHGQLQVYCPDCREYHYHGAGPDLSAPIYGHRVSHCYPPNTRRKTQPNPDGGYILVPPAS